MCLSSRFVRGGNEFFDHLRRQRSTRRGNRKMIYIYIYISVDVNKKRRITSERDVGDMRAREGGKIPTPSSCLPLVRGDKSTRLNNHAAAVTRPLFVSGARYFRIRLRRSPIILAHGITVKSARPRIRNRWNNPFTNFPIRVSTRNYAAYPTRKKLVKRAGRDKENEDEVRCRKSEGERGGEVKYPRVDHSRRDDR